VVAVAKDSLAALSGIVPGMLIEQVNHQGVQGIKDFEGALKEASQNPPVLFLVNSKGTYRYLVLAVPRL